MNELVVLNEEEKKIKQRETRKTKRSKQDGDQLTLGEECC